MTTPPFDHLLAAFSPRLHRAALGLVGEEQSARELAQESLLRAWRARERYDRDRPFYPWLYRILRNAVSDSVRRRRPLPGLEATRVPDPAPHRPLAALEAEQSIARVRRGLAHLSLAHREVLGMRHFQDLSYAEMAELLEVPIGTVMSRLFRARKALLAAIGPEDA